MSGFTWRKDRKRKTPDALTQVKDADQRGRPARLQPER